MQRRYRKLLTFLALFLFPVLAFQNCGETPFAEVEFENPNDTSGLSSCDPECEPVPKATPVQGYDPEDYSAELLIEGVTSTVEGGLLTVNFVLTELLDHPLVIHYKLEQGSAYAGSDFRYQDGVVTIPSGYNTTSVSVQTRSDEDSFEGRESFHIVVHKLEGEARRPNPEVLYIEEDTEQLLPRGSESGQIATASDSSCVIIQHNNSIYTEPSGVLTTNNQMNCWGEEPTSQRSPSADVMNGDMIGNRKPVNAVGGSGFFCYSTYNFIPRCFGSKTRSGSLSQGQLPVQPFNSGFAHAMAAGKQHVCAIMGNNRNLYCWGWNNWGQTGGSQIGSNRFTAPENGMINFNFGGEVFNDSVQAVAAGVNHTCAIVRGALFCWGRNSLGQVGSSDDTTDKFSIPQMVKNMESGVTAVAAGRMHTCAIKDDTVYCWGDNEFWQIGNGESGGDTRTTVWIPTAVKNLGDMSNFRRIVAGNDHTCVMNYGTVKCWGSSKKGQVGTGKLNAELFNADYIDEGLSIYVSDISAGANHTCAIYKESLGDAASKVACWGDSESFQTGIGVDAPQDTPQTLTDIEVLSHYNSHRAPRLIISDPGSVQVGDGSSPFTNGSGWGL